MEYCSEKIATYAAIIVHAIDSTAAQPLQRRLLLPMALARGHKKSHKELDSLVTVIEIEEEREKVDEEKEEEE